MGRLRAYVVDLQSSLNAAPGGPRIARSASRCDGEWGEHTALAFGRVCRVLGIEPARNVRTFRRRRRGHAAAHARRSSRAPRPTAPPTRSACAITSPTSGTGNGGGGGGPAARPAATRSRARSAPTAGASRPSSCARPGARGLPVALACAVLEKETGFRNVFGHDAVRNPVKSPPGGLLAVTEDNYRQYLGSPPPGARQPGRRADAADQPVAAGPRRPARRLLAAGPEHPRRPRVPRGQHPPHGAARRGGRLQRLGPGRAALRRRRAGPRAAVGRSACAARARRVPTPDRAHHDPTPAPAPRPARRGPSASSRR